MVLMILTPGTRDRKVRKGRKVKRPVDRAFYLVVICFELYGIGTVPRGRCCSHSSCLVQAVLLQGSLVVFKMFRFINALLCLSTNNNVGRSADSRAGTEHIGNKIMIVVETRTGHIGIKVMIAVGIVLTDAVK